MYRTNFRLFVQRYTLVYSIHLITSTRRSIPNSYDNSTALYMYAHELMICSFECIMPVIWNVLYVFVAKEEEGRVISGIKNIKK